MPFDPDDLSKKNNTGKDQKKPGNEDFINSSFAVQFRPGDKSNSVADKLKEENEVKDDFDNFKDEFDDFEIDDTFNAFKPLEDKESSKSPFSSEKEKPKAVSEPAKKAESGIPAFPKNGGTFDRKPSDDISDGPDKSNTPVFGNAKGQSRPAAESKKDEKLFNSGKDLDYATSEHDKNKSPFANASRPEADRADKKPEVKTYGTVSSGVNAFKSEKTKDETPDITAEKKKAPAPFTIKPTPSPKIAVPSSSEAEQRAPRASAHTAPATAKAVQQEKSSSVAAPHTAPATAKAVQNEKSASDNTPHTPPASAKAALALRH